MVLDHQNGPEEVVGAGNSNGGSGNIFFGGGWCATANVSEKIYSSFYCKIKPV